MTKKLIPYKIQSTLTKTLKAGVDRVNEAFDAICRDWYKLGVELIKLENQLKKNPEGKGAVERELRFSWKHADRIISAHKFLDKLTARQRLQYPVAATGTMVVIARWDKKKLKSALEEKVPCPDTGREVPLIRSTTLREEVESFSRRYENPGGNSNKTIPKNWVQHKLSISFSPNINADYLQDKLVGIDNLSDKEFKVDFDDISKILKKYKPPPKIKTIKKKVKKK